MKNFISLLDLGKKDIANILEIAAQMRRIYTSGGKKGPQLIGSVIGGVWTDCGLQSVVFDLAATYLSGSYCPTYGAEGKAERCLALDSMSVNTVVAQADSVMQLKQTAALMRCGVVNGGTADSDPIGVLAILMALSMRLDGLQNLNILAVGNRDVSMLDELIYCLQLFGSDLVWYLPADDTVTQRKGVVLNDAAVAFAGVDAVIDLGLRQDGDRSQYYGSEYGIPDSLLDKARVNCPMLGGRFVCRDGKPAIYADSIENLRQSCRVAVAMAVLYVLRKEQ